MKSSKLGDSDLINLLKNLINGLNIITAQYEVCTKVNCRLHDIGVSHVCT